MEYNAQSTKKASNKKFSGMEVGALGKKNLKKGMLTKTGRSSKNREVRQLLPTMSIQTLLKMKYF